jgi:hypothetical protein
MATATTNATVENCSTSLTVIASMPGSTMPASRLIGNHGPCPLWTP